MPLVGNDKKAFTNIFECINHDIILWYIIRVVRPRISLNNCKWSQVHIDSIRHLCQTVRDGSWQATTGESLEKIESWPVCYYLVLVSYKEHDYSEYYFGACVHHVPMNYRSYELRALSLYSRASSTIESTHSVKQKLVHLGRHIAMRSATHVKDIIISRLSFCVVAIISHIPS